MNLNELQREVEDKAVEYLNVSRLEALEEKALYQLNMSAQGGYVRLHKLEFSALLNAVRGLQRKRQQLEAELSEANRCWNGSMEVQAELETECEKLRAACRAANEWLHQANHEGILALNPVLMMQLHDSLNDKETR